MSSHYNNKGGVDVHLRLYMFPTFQHAMKALSVENPSLFIYDRVRKSTLK
jgi:hypothetical protein